MTTISVPMDTNSRDGKSLSGTIGNNPTSLDCALSHEDKGKSHFIVGHLKSKKNRKSRREREMEEEIFSANPGKVHRSGRRKVHSKHDHKCHKAKHKSTDSTAEKMRFENFLWNKKVSSEGGKNLAEAASPTEILSPFEMNVALAYRHVKSENDKLKEEILKMGEDKDKFSAAETKLREENESLREDVSIMKNLVFKLNLELERYQSGNKKLDENAAKLPKNFDSKFLKPVLPLLKAYAETVAEKTEMIESLESEFKKFNSAFNELVQENEKLHGELEKKFEASEGAAAFNEIKVLKKDLELAKQENNLLFQQINLEKEKLSKVLSVFKLKVDEISKEKQTADDTMEEYKTDLLVTRGKYTVLKQEFERLKMDHDTRIPMAVHTASINECRKLFQDLKNEYENEKQRLNHKIKQQEEIVLKQGRQEERWAEEKNLLEMSNFNQNFEVEVLKKRIAELEKQLVESRSGNASASGEKYKREAAESRRQLREANYKVEELSKRLGTTRKQLQKAMVFAEDIVRGQESLLLQLHEKEKENNQMSTQFGSLKSQIKDVERGAQEGLNSIEKKIRGLEEENYALTMHNQKLEKLLMEKENVIKSLEPTKDFSTS